MKKWIRSKMNGLVYDKGRYWPKMRNGQPWPKTQPSEVSFAIGVEETDASIKNK